jgi:hypothetical protein
MTLRINTCCVCIPAVLLLATLGACSRSAPQDLAWARSALERNGTLEVVSTDEAANTLTVRIKSTGQLRVVKPSELIAALPPDARVGTLTDEQASPSAAAPAAEPSTAVASTAATPSAPPAQSSAPQESAPPPAAPAPAAPAHSESSAATTTATPTGRPSGANKHLLASGPGYSISAAGPAAVATGTTSQAQPSDIDARSGSLPLEQRHEPLVCQGQRMLHIDNRNLEFDGDAVSAEDGCELYITNSRIIARGVGVSARAANVHIDNSTITGSSGSVSAVGGAQIYAQSSEFKGSIHADAGAFHDLGGNVGN